MAFKLVPIEEVESKGKELIVVLREPDRMSKEFEHFTVEKIKKFTKAVLTIKEILGKAPSAEKDKEQYNVYKKNLYDAAALNIALIISYFSRDFVEENKTSKFKDPSKEYMNMASLAAFAIYDLLPSYQGIAMKAAITSPFREVQQIATDIYREHVEAGRDVYSLFDAEVNQLFKKTIRQAEKE